MVPGEVETLQGALQKHAGLAVVIGIVMVVCGLLAVASPLVAGLAVTIWVGVLLAFGGVGQCLLAFRAGALGRGLLIFVIGALTTVAGLYLVTQPLQGLVDLTIVLMIFFVVAGVFELVASLQLRPTAGWGWMAFNGVVTLALGIMIWRQFPVSGSWAVGLLFGIRMLLSGWTLVAIGTALRRAGAAAAN